VKKLDATGILGILDRCCDYFTFPMLDNGYVYLAATRMSLFRSPGDWALVIEVFGFSPRGPLPDTQIYSFASRLYNRDTREQYVSAEAYENYLANNPNNDSRFVYPIAEGSWKNREVRDEVSRDAREVSVRGESRPVPGTHEYARYGIVLAEPPTVHIFELSRFLAAVLRDDVLATEQERRVSVLPEMTQILQLEEWHHPDVSDFGARPSGSPTFLQLAEVLASGDATKYEPTEPPNTHWRHWPEGGTL
jgi:hypothetical protein